MVTTLSETFPKSSLLEQLCMQYADVDALESLLAKRLQSSLRKAIPTLFMFFRHLYRWPEKVQVLDKLLSSYDQNLRQHQSLTGAGGTKDLPSVAMCLAQLRALHYDKLKQVRVGGGGSGVTGSPS